MSIMQSAWMRWVSGLSPQSSLLLGGFLLLLVAIGDFVTSADMAFTLLYLAPISLVCWKVSRNAGLVFALLSSLNYAATDFLTRVHPLHPSIAIWNSLVQLGVYTAYCVAFSASRHHLLTEQVLARRDPLTNLLNRRGFDEALEGEIERQIRYGHPFALAFLDLDNFKEVNDTHGHAVGDQLLRELAVLLLAGIRHVDTAARLGGDEFSLLMPETKEEEAKTLVDRLSNSIGSWSKNRGWAVSLSIGVGLFATAPSDAHCAVEFADNLMYEVKHGGKGHVRFLHFDDTFARSNQSSRA